MNKLQSFFKGSKDSLSMKRFCALALVITAIYNLTYCNMQATEPHGIMELLGTALALLSVEPISKTVTSFSNNNNTEEE